jgi:hypothetical protein
MIISKKLDVSGVELLNVNLYRCPRTASPQKKGSIWINVIIRILKKKSLISKDNPEKTS